jgi:hypothetical protein
VHPLLMGMWMACDCSYLTHLQSRGSIVAYMVYMNVRGNKGAFSVPEPPF